MKALRPLLLLLLASCAGTPLIAPSSLVGEWRYADKVQSCHYIFEKNGTFRGDVTQRSQVISKFTGRWLIESDALLYQYVSDVLGKIPAGATDRDKLLSLNRESFVIEAADGSRRQYLRVR